MIVVRVGVEATLNALLELVNAQKVQPKTLVAAQRQMTRLEREYLILEDVRFALVLEVHPRLDEPLEAGLTVPSTRRLVCDQYIPDLIRSWQIQVEIAFG